MPTWGWIIIGIVAYWAGFATSALLASRRIKKAEWHARYLWARLHGEMEEKP